MTADSPAPADETLLTSSSIDITPVKYNEKKSLVRKLSQRFDVTASPILADNNDEEDVNGLEE